MGYSTDYKGTLKITCPITPKLLSIIDDVLYERPQKGISFESDKSPKRYEIKGFNNYYIDLMLIKNNTVKFNGGEKSYDMDKQIELFIKLVQKQYPEFSLSGTFKAQGERIDDKYRIEVAGTEVTKIKEKHEGIKFKCPECDGEYYVKIVDGKIKVIGRGY